MEVPLTVPIQLYRYFKYDTICFVWINFRKEFNIFNLIGKAKRLATLKKTTIQ